MHTYFCTIYNHSILQNNNLLGVEIHEVMTVAFWDRSPQCPHTMIPKNSFFLELLYSRM